MKTALQNKQLFDMSEKQSFSEHAQKPKVFDKVKEESIYLLILLAISIIALKILFYKEEFIVILKLVLSFFWVFIIPGLSIMFYWEDKLSFTERLVIGVGLTAAVIGISSYYLGLIGLNIKYHTILLPLLCLILGIVLIFTKKPSEDQSDSSKDNKTQ